MKEIQKNLLKEFFKEAEEFFFLRQKKFYDENKENFPLLIYNEKEKKWTEIFFERGEFRVEYISSRSSCYKYMDFFDVKDRVIEIMSEVEDFVELWKIVNEFIEEKLQKLKVAIENAKEKCKKYNEEKEQSEIYSEYVRLKIEEKLK